MKKLTLTLLLLLCFGAMFCQQTKQAFSAQMSDRIDSMILQDYQEFSDFFREAYALYPTVPQGILEAVSYNYTRFHHLVPAESDTCGYMPPTYGVMGLTRDGRGYFRENLRLVSQLSGISEEDIVRFPRANIMAYAAAYAALQRQMQLFSSDLQAQIPILNALSELPQTDRNSSDFASQSNLYAIFQFFDKENFRNVMDVRVPPADYDRCFGAMLPYLQAPRIAISEKGKVFLVENIENQYDSIVDALDMIPSPERNADYANAIWNPAASCNYSSRNGRQVSAITIHYTQGTYAGSISWFQNCSASVSAHYVLRSSDGQITQMVREADKAWHVGNSNGYTVGLEHEAYGNIYSYFTPAMYATSADLTRDICDRHGIMPTRMFYRDTLDDGTVLNNGLHDLGGETACTKIRGHQHYPSQSHTDPGKYWNWNYYFKLVNDDTPIQRYTDASGIFTDSGGENGDYANDERKLYLIEVPDAEAITLSFSEFDLEDDYDFMWIYDGNNVFAPLLGRWNTQSPGTITSSGNALLIEFRSDCATTAPGWVAYWRAHVSVQDEAPVTEIDLDDQQWYTSDFTAHFQDEDDHGLMYRFYQVMGNTGTHWTANCQRGFLCDNFDDFNASLWTSHSGNWGENNHQLQQIGNAEAKLSAPLNANLSNAYLYDFYAVLSGNNTASSRFEVRFYQDDDQFHSAENGYAIVFLPYLSQIQIAKYENGTRRMLASAQQATSFDTYYYYRLIHDRQTGKIRLFRNGQLMVSAQDSRPHTTPGQYFAFETKNADVTIDNLRIYRSRDSITVIKVNGATNCDACYQASNGAARTKIKSVVVDDAGQFSALKEMALKVDYSRPVFSGTVADGMGVDADTWESTTYSANWNAASDAHSGIQQYEYELYDVAPSSTVDAQYRWKGITTTNMLTARFPFLPGHQYRLRVRAKNHADIYSSYNYSDGFTYRPNTSRESKFVFSAAPNPVADVVTLYLTQVQSLDEAGETSPCADLLPLAVVKIYDIYGKMILEKELTEPSTPIQMRNWASGLYIFQVFMESEQVGFEKIIKQ